MDRLRIDRLSVGSIHVFRARKNRRDPFDS
jgi:hypothetical protein